MAEHTHSSLEQALSSDAYNAPGLSPIEFLRAVMEATHQPMSIRIEAAKGLLPYTNSVPRPVAPPAYTIVIPPLSLEPWSHICSPWPRSPGDPTGNHSQNLVSPEIPVTRDGEAGDPQNLTRYSDPPTPAELQEIKAAINALRPDLAHLPVPEFHLCPCGHWITGEYDCCRRELSKLN
jgi:hypothetical protein